jgi:hypothetical protein
VDQEQSWLHVMRIIFAVDVQCDVHSAGSEDIKFDGAQWGRRSCRLPFARLSS